MFYLYLKVFHIIGVIVWFAGLFYLGRLYVYHREADDRPEPERTTMKTQFSLMERRLYYGIAWPGLCISVVFGIALIIELGFPGWLHAKLAFAVVLVGYHIWCGHLRKMLLNDQCGWSGTKFRLFNEVPTLLLFSIVFIVVFKSAISWNVFLLVLAGLILVIVGAMQLRAKRSKK
ncbi:MAG: hypothetical protein MAG581_00413 [Deltaproteobacteria bacterium]|jgi:putative membrane protein|nr:hypothetical protein [Deltaproteobacteria bacterium]